MVPGGTLPIVDVLAAEVNRVVARQLGHVHGATDVIGGELARDGLALGEDRAAAAVVTCHVGVVASSRLLGTLPPPLLVVIALMLKVSSSSKWSLSPPRLSVGSQNCLMSASVHSSRRWRAPRCAGQRRPRGSPSQLRAAAVLARPAQLGLCRCARRRRTCCGCNRLRRCHRACERAEAAEQCCEPRHGHHTALISERDR